jgi:single-strand DNA-binding protein
MADINHFFCIGRLTQDASIKYTQNGDAVVEFSIAVNRRKGKDGSEYADFFQVSTWGKQGEGLKQYLVKGKQVAIEGNLRQDRWQDEQGAKKSKVYINAFNIQLLGGTRIDNLNGAPGAGAGQYGGGQQYGAPFGNSAGGQYGAPQGNGGGQYGGDGFPEDIPF